MTDTNDDIDALIQRWIVAFCEMPVLIDKDLMRAVLDDTPDHGASS